MNTPNINDKAFKELDFDQLGSTNTEPVKIALLYGSLRERSYSRLLVEEATQILQRYGAETRIFNPSGLPLPDDNADATHEKVAELRDIISWSEGMVWCSTKITTRCDDGIMKAQIDWIPLSIGSVRPTQGKTLAVMQVSGGSQSFNTVNQLRILGRWMRCLTIPNQSSVPKAFQQFDDEGRMSSSFYNRVVDQWRNCLSSLI